jgi:ribonuclease D
VAFAARQELLFCRQFAGRLPEMIFDPQLAAGLVGFGYPISHTNLVRSLFETQLAGSEAYTDWRRRPLNKQQLTYAADDVRFLLPGRQMLLERADSMGRVEWLQGEFRALAAQAEEPDRREEWWRAPGASRMKPRQRAVLRELWNWRDRRARAVNLPPRRVMRDDLLVEIARRSPRNASELYALRGMDRPALRKAEADLIDAVQTGMNMPESDLPKPGPARGPEDPPQVAILGQLLGVLTNNVAGELQVAPTLLATVADLQEFVRWHLGLSEGAPPEVLQGWRGEVLGQALEELLEGQRFIRVADAESANPLRIERLTTD